MAGSLLTFSFPLLSEKERVNTSDIKLSECSWYKSYEMTTWMVSQLLFSIPRFKKWKTNWYQPLSTAATVWYLKYHIYVPLQYVFQYLPSRHRSTRRQHLLPPGVNVKLPAPPQGKGARIPPHSCSLVAVCKCCMAWKEISRAILLSKRRMGYVVSPRSLESQS